MAATKPSPLSPAKAPGESPIPPAAGKAPVELGADQRDSGVTLGDARRLPPDRPGVSRLRRGRSDRLRDKRGFPQPPGDDRRGIESSGAPVTADRGLPPVDSDGPGRRTHLDYAAIVSTPGGWGARLMGTPSDLAAHQPHLRLGPAQLATLFVKGLVSDWRERRGLARPQDDRPWWRALDPRVHDPIFVVGAPCSGTSFLGHCLGAVPGVSYHFEPRLTKAAIRDVYTGAWSRTRAQWTFRTFYGALLIFALDGGRRFVDKTPENSFIVSMLAQTFPTARFVHIVRDGRDVAVSHSEKPWLSALSRVGPAGAWGCSVGAIPAVLGRAREA